MACQRHTRIWACIRQLALKVDTVHFQVVKDIPIWMTIGMQTWKKYLVPSQNRGSLENKNLSRVNTDNASANSSMNSLTLQPSPMLDSLHPDLTIPINTHSNKDTSNKESLDYDDLQTKLEINKLNQLNVKYSKFHKMITDDTNIAIQDLRRLSWNGIPPELRAITWQILLGYLPTNKSRQSSTLKEKKRGIFRWIECC